MIDYYDRRAREYELVYEPRSAEHAAELQLLRAEIERSFAGRRVLEVACGTAYWTPRSAAHVTGVDASPSMLELARAKALPHVELVRGDAYDLPRGDFDAALATFFISHVPRARRRDFLDALHARLAPGALVLLADNAYLPGQGGTLVARGDDTYKQRGGDLVLKNYPTDAELSALLPPGVQLSRGPWFWRALYTSG